MEQAVIDVFNPDTLPDGYLPAANPALVDGYVAIEEILKGRSTDFGTCYECGLALCEHALDEKREDESYKVLVQHFRDGGKINQPLNYDPRYKTQDNGHHRLVAALDAGFTHVPYNAYSWSEHPDWDDVDLEQYGFQVDQNGDLYEIAE